MLWTSDDYVIKQFNTKQSTSRDEPLGDGQVFRAWAGISGRVIVYQDDCRAVARAHCISPNRAGINQAARQSTDMDAAHAQRVMLGRKVNNQDVLLKGA